MTDIDPVQPLLVERLGSRDPTAPAIHYLDRSMSWRELDTLSSGFASHLVARGFASGRVGIFMQNMPEFVIAMLGAWKAGAAVVPINPMLKSAELEHIISDSRSSVLIGLDYLLTDDLLGVAMRSGVESVLQVSARDLAGTGPLAELIPVASTRDLGHFLDCCTGGDGFQVVQADRDGPAFVTYTSGTTGRPKGAVNTHANVAYNSAAMAEWHELDRFDTILGIAPLFHITGLVAHIGISIVSGAPLVLGHRFDAALMLRLIQQHRPTFTIGAITAFIALLDHPDRPTTDLSSLAKVWSGGAPVSPAVVDRFEREIGPYIHNAYGLTESTAATHLVPMGERAPVDPTSGALSIGVACANTSVRVVDDDGQEVAVGAIGEFVISGPQIAAGYWEKPDASAETFTPMGLRTGDVGFVDHDGWYFLVDRRKDMIIASGYKVWPREVEDVLYQHPAVREAAVIGVPDDYRGETVKAFVSVVSGKVVDDDELIGFCRDRLANYKAPRVVEVLAELPKTASGKILRRELRHV